MESGLADKAIAITGASGGIGMATARVLAAEGARLVLHAHRHPDRIESLAAELDVEATCVVGDLRDEDAADALIERGVDAFGSVDGVVVNAGVWADHAVPLHAMSLAQWRDTIDADLTSAFLTCRAFMRQLEHAPRPDAAIVLVASTAAVFGEAGHADYAAAKAAMAYGLTRTLKNEIVQLAPRGRVNCVCPGWTRTPMAEPHMNDEVLERVFATMPMRKVAEADDVAHAIAFLLSGRLAGHLTGTIVPIAGGMEGRRLD